MDYPVILHYLYNLLPERPAEMQAMEAYARKTGLPILEPAAAHFCYLIARLGCARSVFELSSGFGYSTAWFARAVRENGGGTVYHNAWDPEDTARARRHLSALELDELVEFHTGDPLAALRANPGPFDLIFSDAELPEQLENLALVAEKLRPGGVLLVDHLLWYGQVFNGTDHAPATQAVRRFTLKVTGDPAWTASIVPVGGGLLLAQKNES